MLAFAVTVSFDTPSADEADVLAGIGEAFWGTLDRNAGGGAVAVVFAVAAVAMALAAVRWLRRDARREQREHAALDVRREAIVAEAAARPERRQWVRVPAHLEVSVLRGTPNHVHYDDFETLNVGGGGIAFLADKPPPTGTPMDVLLDLGDGEAHPHGPRRLSMHGVVVRVEPSANPTAGAPSLVALAFGNVANASRERLMKWIAEEETREIADARRGRTCPCCGRPLADSAQEMHVTCARTRPSEVVQTGGAPGAESAVVVSAPGNARPTNGTSAGDPVPQGRENKAG